VGKPLNRRSSQLASRAVGAFSDLFARLDPDPGVVPGQVGQRPRDTRRTQIALFIGDSSSDGTHASNRQNLGRANRTQCKLYNVPINEWWRGDDSERYWVEIADRSSDLGEDLNIPTQDRAGRSYAGYELINFIRPGDVVFHWHKERGGASALVAWSIATGIVENIQTEWQSRGSYGRAAAPAPPRPAWLMRLTDCTRLDLVVTYQDIQGLETQIRDIYSDLKQAHTGPLYFPFTFSDTQGMRPAQTYLRKFPRALAELLQIAYVGAVKDDIADAEQTLTSLGVTDLRRPVEQTLTQITGYTRSARDIIVKRAESALVTEFTKSLPADHNATRLIVTSGVIDLAVEAPGRVEIIEAKSSTRHRKVREALGQILDYAHSVVGPVDRIATLFPARPSYDDVALLGHYGIDVIYRNDDGAFERRDASDARRAVWRKEA
jgi:hypothetical protein